MTLEQSSKNLELDVLNLKMKFFNNLTSEHSDESLYIANINN